MAFGNSALIVNTTINKYLRKVTMAIMRKRFILAALQSKGRVTLNHSGKKVEWKIRHKRSPMSTFQDGDTIVFQRESKHKTATLEWRAYIVSGAMSMFDKEQNKGTEAIVKLWSDAVKERTDDIRDQFHEKIYNIDGNASGYTAELHGLPSAFSASASASSLVGTNDDTYGGLSTARGVYGSWTGTWPDGYGQSQYDYNTPLVVNYTSPLAASSGGWDASTKTWPNTCVQAIRYGIINTERNGDTLDAIVLEKNLYRQLLDAAAVDTRLIVNRNQDPGMTKLGFRGINVDGVDIHWEVGLPSGYGYGLCYEHMELMSLQDQLFKSKTEFNLESVSDRVMLAFFGNLKLDCLRCLTQWRALS